MKTFFAATAAAALALTAAPTLAQDMDDMDGDMVELTTAQQTMYDGWPADRRTTYDAWPMEAQTYYWTLTPAQTEAWWMLNNEQRVRVVGMTEAQRGQAWTSILSQVNGTAAPAATATAPASSTAMANASTTATTQGNVVFVSREMAQAPKKAAVTGDLPVCTANQQDGCINSWEKNKTGNRPLEYWPGRPASQIDGPLPATQAEYDSMASDDDDN